MSLIHHHLETYGFRERAVRYIVTIDALHGTLSGYEVGASAQLPALELAWAVTMTHILRFDFHCLH